MSGGLMQLVAHGAQDIYLTDIPQITFFKKFTGIMPFDLRELDKYFKAIIVLIDENKLINKEELEDLSCSICVSLFNNPVTIPCGHSFCRSCLGKCIYPTCPLCRTNFNINHTIPNFDLDNKIGNMLINCNICNQVHKISKKCNMYSCTTCNTNVHENERFNHLKNECGGEGILSTCTKCDKIYHKDQIIRHDEICNSKKDDIKQKYIHNTRVAGNDEKMNKRMDALKSRLSSRLGHGSKMEL